MNNIKVGSRVRVTKTNYRDNTTYGIKVGSTGTVVSVDMSYCTDGGCVFIDWDDVDAPNRPMYSIGEHTQLELIEDDEPDLFLYPDTPKGTKIVAIQDTESAYGVKIPKGSVLELQAMTYNCGGTHIAASWDGSYRNGMLVNVEHFMIWGINHEI